MRWSLWLSFTMFALGACGTAERAQRTQPDSKTALPPTPLRELSMRVSFEAVDVTRRLERRFELPEHRVESRCAPDAIRVDDAHPESSVLTLGVADARIEGKILLPIAFTRELESSELAALERHFQSSGALDSSQAYRQLKTEADGQAALAELDALRQRRYRAVLHIVDYREPELIYSLRHNRREWTQGTVSAWLAIHDAETGEALCQTLVAAHNETDGVPVARRAREGARARLITELGSGLRRVELDALSRMSPKLRPPSVYGTSGPLALDTPGPG